MTVHLSSSSRLVLVFPTDASSLISITATYNSIISMLFPTFWVTSLASLAMASPFHNPNLADRDDLAALCGYPNGNCYENGCEGDRSFDGMTCTAV